MSEVIKRLSRLPGDRRAAFIARLREAPVEPTGLRAHPRTGPVPLSYAQEPLWFLDRLAPGQATYNISTAYWLRGPLDVPALTRALQTVVDRHEALRTTLHESEQGPVQRILAHLEVDLPVVPVPADGVAGSDVAARNRAGDRDAGSDEMGDDAAGRNAGGPTGRARELALAQARQPFDLSRAPLWRLSLFQLGTAHHLLVFTVHHAICDGWSLGVFARDLAAAYTAALSQPATVTGGASPGTLPGRPDLPLQYADYTLWQRQWLAGSRKDELVAFWRERLNGLPILQLPTDRPRPATVTYRGAYLRRILPRPLLAAVHRLAQTEQVTANAVLLAAFLTLLHRYSGQDDLVVGSPNANRGQVEVEELIGYFVNMVVIRGDLSGDPDTRQLLARVRTALSDALAHAELPFEKLVEALRPERDPSRSPLFQIAFTYQNAGGEPLELPGLTVREESLDPGTSRFDISWNTAERESGLEVYVEYNTDLFDEATIDALIRHFERVVTAMAEDPRLPVSRLPLLDGAERQDLLNSWNGPTRPVPEGTVVDHFEAHVRRDPDAVALVVRDDVLSYAELDRRAGLLAGALRQAGAGPGTLVAICLPRRVDLIVAVLAVLKAGAGYVPVDPGYPPGRMAAILDDAAPVAVLTCQEVADRLPAGHPPRLLVEHLPGTAPSGASQTATTPTVPAGPGTGTTPAAACADPADVAYVIYTSGTTGTPKGVSITHRQVVNFIADIADIFQLTPADRVLAFAALNFDVSVFEIFSALLTGARLYLVDDEQRLDMPQLQRLMEDGEITVIDLPPTVMALLDPDRFPALRVVFAGVEKYSGELVNRWSPGRRFFNGYGPTECTVTMVVHEVPQGHWTSQPPIGLPMANHVAHVVDQHLQLVPYGVAGELVIGGVGLTSGYLNAPELTADKIFPDPFGTAPGGRLYHTGDLVRRQRDGALVFLGRIDHQVKLRGLRLELGEVESVLATHPAITQAVVQIWVDSHGEQQLVAYTTHPDPDAVPDGAELRDFLAEYLPAWMLPTYYIPLPAFPVNVSGKVDRRALPVPDEAARAAGTDSAAPGTETERILVEEIFGPLLGLTQVGVHDNFFALGGHSLQATGLMSRIRSRFGVEVGLAAFFRAPTVANLAALIDRGRAAALDDEAMLALIERMSDDEAAKLLAADPPS